ncbi:MAG TPA: hypothetical protein VGM37_13930 [Armatimonadota bacterium]|jgi:O-antigen ligase
MDIPFLRSPKDQPKSAPDATSALIIALHAAALLLYFVKPLYGAALMAVAVAVAMSLARPLVIAAFCMAFLWVNAVMGDFMPTTQFTAWKDVLLLLVLGGWLMRCIALRRPLVIRHRIAIPLTLIVLYFFAMCVLTPDYRQAILGLKNTVFYMAWFYVLPDMVRSKDDVRTLLAAILFGAFCLGVYDVWRSTMPIGYFPPGRDGRTLPGALMLHFSGTSIFLAPGVILAIATAPSYRSWHRVLVYVVVMIALAGIIAALARGVWACTSIAFAGMMIWSRRTQLVQAAVLALIAASVVQAVFPLNVAERAASAFDTEDVSRNDRELEFSTVTLPFVLSHPFGAGTGSMSAVGSIQVWGGGSPADMLLGRGRIHNGFLLVAIELGWLGLGIYLWFLGTVLYTSMELYRNSRDPYIRDLALGLFGVMIFFVIYNFSGPMLTTPLFSYNIWALVGLLVILPSLDDAPALEAAPVAIAAGAKA